MVALPITETKSDNPTKTDACATLNSVALKNRILSKFRGTIKCIFELS